MSEIHPSDRVYYLTRALEVCTKAGESADVLHALRALRDEALRDARLPGASA